MYRKSLFLFISFLFSFQASSQNESLKSVARTDLIKNQLSKGDFKKILALESDEKEALSLMQLSDKNYEELGKLKQDIENERNKKKLDKLLKKAIKFEKLSIKKRIESLKLYHEVFVQKYKIYKEDLKKYFPNSTESQVVIARKLEDSAYYAFESADLDIDKVYYTINQTDLFEIFTRAFQSEQIGLLYQEKMYAFFLNWDVVITERLDEEIYAFTHNEPIEENKRTNEEIKIRDSIKIKTVLVYDTVKIIKTEAEVIYKVQVAASKTKISEDRLGKIYPSVQLINFELDNGWCKYTVGYFKHYNEAQKFKINSGVPDAFIVAYKNGKRTSISELINHPSYKEN